MTRQEMIFSLQTRFSVWYLAITPFTGKRLISLLPWALLIISAGILHTMNSDNETPFRLSPRSELVLPDNGPGLSSKLPLFVPKVATSEQGSSRGKWLTANWHPGDPALLDAPPTRLSIRLTGTLTGSEDRNMAIISQNDQQQSVRPGEMLSSIPVKVIRIAEDRIVIETSGEYATVHFTP